MGKLVIILVLMTLACRLFLRRWPWDLAGISAQSSEEARARALLGVGRGASRDEIIEAHRRLVTQVHPDRGGSADQVVEANAARDLLLARLVTPKRKTE